MGRPTLPQTHAAAKAIADVNRARVHAQKELTEKYRLENAITRAEYLERAGLAKGLAMVVDAMTSRITAADIPRAVKDDLLKDIASLPLILEEVAHGQSRLAAATNRKGKQTVAAAKKEEAAAGA